MERLRELVSRCRQIGETAGFEAEASRDLVS